MLKYSLWRMHKRSFDPNDTLIKESDDFNEISKLQQKQRRTSYIVTTKNKFSVIRFFIDGIIVPVVKKCDTFEEALTIIDETADDLESLFISSQKYQPKMKAPYVGDFAIMAPITNLKGKSCGMRFYNPNGMHITTLQKSKHKIINHDSIKYYLKKMDQLENKKKKEQKEHQQRIFQKAITVVKPLYRDPKILIHSLLQIKNTNKIPLTKYH